MKLICRQCGEKFSLRRLGQTSGRCPNCKAEVPVSDYCVVRPETNMWRLFFAAPWGVKIVASAFVFTVAYFVVSCSAAMILGMEHGGIAALFVLLILYLPAKIFVRVVFRFMVLGGGLVITPVLLCLWAYIVTSVVAEMGSVDLNSIAVFAILIGLFVLNLLPSSRRWTRICRDERRAFAIVSKFNPDAAWRMPFKSDPPRVAAAMSVLFLVGMIVLAGLAAYCVIAGFEPVIKSVRSQNGTVALPKETHKTNVTDLANVAKEDMVIPPGSDKASTLEDAVRDILRQVGKNVGAVSSNGIDKLVMPYCQLGDGKSYEVEWRKALRLLLAPVSYDFIEDGDLVRFGTAEECSRMVQVRLAVNRTPILFATNECEGGMELRNAIREVSIKADVTITTDYMDPDDLYMPVQTDSADGTLTADDIRKAKSCWVKATRLGIAEMLIRQIVLIRNSHSFIDFKRNVMLGEPTLPMRAHYAL